jgi:hypothetical protein
VTGRSDGARGARHIIGEVQRFGLLSAASVVDRYVEIINRESLGDPLRHARGALGGISEGSVGAAARMLEAGLQALDASARLISDAVAAGSHPLVLPPTEPGLASEASVWIHNCTSSLVASVQLHATILVSTEESSIPRDAVRFRPDEAVRVEPGTCQEVTVRVSVPEGQPLGLYHGLLVGSGAPDGAITLRLAVEGPAGGSS